MIFLHLESYHLHYTTHLSDVFCTIYSFFTKLLQHNSYLVNILKLPTTVAIRWCFYSLYYQTCYCSLIFIIIYLMHTICYYHKSWFRTLRCGITVYHKEKKPIVLETHTKTYENSKFLHVCYHTHLCYVCKLNIYNYAHIILKRTLLIGEERMLYDCYKKMLYNKWALLFKIDHIRVLQRYVIVSVTIILAKTSYSSMCY